MWLLKAIVKYSSLLQVLEQSIYDTSETSSWYTEVRKVQKLQKCWSQVSQTMIAIK